MVLLGGSPSILRLSGLAALSLTIALMACAQAGFYTKGSYGDGRFAPGDNTPHFTGQLMRLEVRDHPGYVTKDATGTPSISAWIDRSGNGNEFQQGTKSKQPNLNAKSVTFVPSDAKELKLISAKLGLIRNKPILCGMFQFNPRVNHVGYLYWGSEGVTASNYRLAFRVGTASSGKFEMYQRRTDGGQSFSLSSSNTYNSGQSNIGGGCINYTANTATVFLNGTTTTGAAGSTGATSDTNSLNSAVGSSNSSNYFDGSIGYASLFTDPAQLATEAAWAASVSQ